MKYRTTEILDEKSLAGAGTEVIPINVKDIISRINLSWRVTATKEGMDSYPHKDILKIELTDGSDVLHSMDGGQNQALCIYSRKVGTMNHGQHLSANSEFSNYGIDFGRWLWDKELAFDPKQFNNPMLKVTYDVDVCDTGAVAGNLEVWADCFDEKIISPIGFFMSKEHFNAGTPDSGYTYVILPTDHPYRKLLIQGYHKAYEPWYVIASAKLNEDNGKRIPFDVNLEQYFRARKGIDPPVDEQFNARGAAGGNAFYVTPTSYWTNCLATVNGNAGDPYQTEPGRGGYLVWFSTATEELRGRVVGYLPNHCFQFPFGEQSDIDDWYDVTKVGSLILRLEEGTHHDDQRQAVILEQLRRY